jgi:biofilm PGA synthesis N-glycosyltransferase PgaC
MDHPEAFPSIAVLIAAYNEEQNLPETVMSLLQQDYPAPVEIIVADDGSTDETVSVLRSLRIPNLTVLQCAHSGKAGALTAGLKAVCIDADTYLHPQALKRIVARLISDPSHTAAVAGCVLVRNSRHTLMTRLQEWDYFLGISSAKRQQALYQGTLVAQGAFSAFKTSALRQCEGWPAVIGEDIVLTWKLLSKGYRIGYEATALCFTNAPSAVSAFWRQRQRWARGMIEGLKRYGSLVWQGNLTGFFVGVDFVIPVIDLFYSLVFLPGVILALTGRYYIVGPMTLLVIPVAFLIVLLMLHKQRQVFEELNLKVRRNSFGFFFFMLLYQPLMSPICLTGYLKELAGVRKRW